MKRYRVVGLVVLVMAVVGGVVGFIMSHDVAVLHPKGVIASQERDLMRLAALLSLFVILPVFIMTFFIAWKYRASNKRARHQPDWDHNLAVESLWWGIPCAIILVLGVITWNSSHRLDPFRAIQSNKKPLTIQVVALQWKWLFIYPEQGIASVNFLEFPKDTPLDFHITADAPMNSFWIPKLGGQVYAMSGMETRLHLMADEEGTFRGSSANISGKGFAGMTFNSNATSQAAFDTWVQSVKGSSQKLDLQTYTTLAHPSENDPGAYYATVEHNLFDTILMKYMPPEDHMIGSPHLHTSTEKY